MACAYQLDRSPGRPSWIIAEATDRVGGAAASVTEDKFVWEFGGHVIFSKIEAFNRLLADLVPAGDLIEHRRSSAISHAGRLVPYPFQRHLRHLPPRDRADALHGLLAVAASPAGPPPANYAEWLAATFGADLVELFFKPYNDKVWSVPLDQMSVGWVGDRVAPMDWRVALDDLAVDEDPPDWGPNQRFLFPRTGGIGQVWAALARRLRSRLAFDRRSQHIDWRERTVTFEGSRDTQDYEHLVSTIPLDNLVEQLVDPPARISVAAAKLRHTKVRVVGLGYQTPTRSDHNWIYFPQKNVPFYRATNPGRNSPGNLPDGDSGRFSSWLVESTDPAALRNPRQAVEEAEQGLHEVGLVDRSVTRIAEYTHLLDRAYPVPTLDRDDALAVLLPWLEEQRIYSRGRMGTWRYELGNVDHAVQMGLEVARRIADGTPERLVHSRYP